MKIIAPIAVLVLLIFAVSAGCITAETVTKETAMPEVTAEINDRLNDAANHIKDAAKEISKGADGKTAIANLYQKTTLAQSILYVDENNYVLAAYPDFIKDSVGKDVSIYGNDENSFADSDVLLSDYMKLEDRTRACVLTVPVKTDGKYKGHVSVAFDTYRLFGSINDNLNEKYGYNMWVVQPNGTQIYDPDLYEVGADILTDSAYSAEDVHKATVEITGKESGTVQYSFKGENTNELYTKEAYWDTFEYGGKKWRVVITSIIQ